VLRREFGISAHEAEHVVPAWEREMLVRRYVQKVRIERGLDEGLADTVGEPLSRVPKEFT
jgi:hypothetical protein